MEEEEMKRKLLLTGIMMLILALCLASTALAGTPENKCRKCGDTEHGFTSVFPFNSMQHMASCPFCSHTNTYNHYGGTATCTEMAICALCGGRYGSPLGHDLAPATCTSPAICQRVGCGYTEGSSLGHNLSPATCTSPITCKNAGCTYTEGSALTHLFTKYISNNDAACLKDGSETAACDHGCGTKDTRTAAGSALTHLFTKYISNSDAVCLKDGTETAACDQGCGTNDTRTAPGSALKHLFTKYVSNFDAVCLKDGSETAACDHGCGANDTKTAPGSALKHAYTALVTAPTCTAGGYTAYTCSCCGDAYKGNETSAPGHTEVIDPAVPAACLQPGLTQGSHCSVCKTVLAAQQALSATGHDYVKTYSPASCASGGTTTFTCRVCGATTIGEETRRLVHWYGAWTLNGDGTHSAFCRRANCGHATTANCAYIELDMDGHSLRVCPVCGDASGAFFSALQGADAAGMDGGARARGELAVFAAEAPFGEDSLSIPGLPEDKGRVLYAFTAGFEFAGLPEPFKGKVSISIPLEGLPDFMLVRLDESGTWVETPYAFQNGILRFETGAPGLFLLISKT